SAEDEFLLGDLLEKYHQGRGQFWYWRQVAAIVFSRLARNARQVSISAAATTMRHAFTVLLVVTVVSVVLLSCIWMIFLFGICGGVIAGALLFLLQRSGGPITTDHLASNHPGISIHHIPVEGAVGLLFAIGTVFVFGSGVPAIREIVVFIAPLG